MGKLMAISLTSAAVLLALPVANAGDRKGTASRDSSMLSDMLEATSRPRATAVHHGDFALAPVTSMEPRHNNVSAPNAAKANDEPRSPKERKKITLFQFDSKAGQIAVQPLVGPINGAQLSMGF